MKCKFDNTNNVLGGIIKTVRKKKNFSQEALGKMVGLGKSSISKMESGRTNLSLEDASILLEAMGEKIGVYVDGLFPSNEVRMQQIRFMTVATCWFAEAKNISRKQAFAYLQKYQGIKFLQENFEYEQTLPKAQVIDDLTTVCNNRKKEYLRDLHSESYRSTYKRLKDGKI